MTSDELRTAKVFLIAALKQRRDAAEAWTRACEYIVPLTNGDPEIVRAARASQCRTEKTMNEAIVGTLEGDAAGLIETFAQKRG